MARKKRVRQVNIMTPDADSFRRAQRQMMADAVLPARAEIKNEVEGGALQDKIIAEARSWLGTPFRHQGFKKGVGCDCSGFIRGVLEAVMGFKYEDAWNYPHRPHAPALIELLNKYFTKIPISDMQPGDVLLFKIDNNPQHMAIKTDRGMIHAYARGPRKVEEVSFASPWPERLVGCWRVADIISLSPRGEGRGEGVTPIENG